MSRPAPRLTKYDIGSIISAVAGTIGALLLVYAFVATSSEQTVVDGDAWIGGNVHAYQHQIAMCVNDETVFERSSSGATMMGGGPAGHRYPVAIVTQEHGWAFWPGIGLVILSVVLTVVTVLRKPPSIAVWD
jgi:hypothetical protein